MGKVFQYVTLKAMREKKIKALVDTGAETSYIKPSVAQYIGAGYSFKAKTILPDGTIEKTDAVSLFIKINKRYVEVHPYVYPIKEDMLLGQDFLQYNRAFIDMSKDKIVFNEFAPIDKKTMRI